MFDENIKKPKADQVFPRLLDGLSVMELEDYVQDLKAEIQRVEVDIVRKKASADAAASVFKS